MLLAAEIEAELRRLLQIAGAPVGSRTTFRDAVNYLRRQKGLSGDLLDSMLKFRDVRNRLIHGYEAKPDDVLRAIDSGLRILDAIRGISRTQ